MIQDRHITAIRNDTIGYISDLSIIPNSIGDALRKCNIEHRVELHKILLLEKFEMVSNLKWPASDATIVTIGMEDVFPVEDTKCFTITVNNKT